jgi:hypothetical protein
MDSKFSTCHPLSHSVRTASTMPSTVSLDQLSVDSKTLDKQKVWWHTPTIQVMWEMEVRGLQSYAGLGKSTRPYLKNN